MNLENIPLIYMYRIILFTLVGLLSVGTIKAQKTILVDADLLANSQPKPVKTRGISSLRKYYFGPYEVVEGKAGWNTTSTTSTGNNTTVGQTKQKMSFIMDGPAGSAKVKANINDFVAEAQWLMGISVDGGTDVRTATIKTSGDSTVWELVMTNSIGEGFKAGINDGEKVYDIKPVAKFDNGKGFLGGIGDPLGYTIYDGGVALACLQTAMQITTWIRDDLPLETKLRLAAAMTSILVLNDAASSQ